MPSATHRDELLARKKAADENMREIDRKFAIKLQKGFRNGKRSVLPSTTAHELLGPAKIGRIMARDPNKLANVNKRVVARPRRAYGADSDDESSDEDLPVSSVASGTFRATCLACEGRFQHTSMPFAMASGNGPFDDTVYGLRFKCGHGYCQEDLITYLNAKLKHGGDAFSRMDCPQCHNGKKIFDDDKVLLILGATAFADWSRKRDIALRPKLYCPHMQCSAQLFKPEDKSVTRATCRSCKEDLCVHCESVWHVGMTCKAFQALPADERSREDSELFALARSSKWKRCPKCKAVVERSYGCRHMSCNCGAQFCYDCGSDFANSHQTCLRGCEGYLEPGQERYVPPPDTDDEGPNPILERVNDA